MVLPSIVADLVSDGTPTSTYDNRLYSASIATDILSLEPPRIINASLS